MTTEEQQELAYLRGEVINLNKENQNLLRTIQDMRQQEAAMAALFRGAQPTLEGRRAHAQFTNRRES